MLQVAALLPPDPEPWPFALEVLESTGCTFAVGLGLGSSVPVFLRWSGKLALHTYSPEVVPSLHAQATKNSHGVVSVLDTKEWHSHIWVLCCVNLLPK